MNDDKISDILFPAFAGCIRVLFPVDEIKPHCAEQKVAKNDDVNR